MTVNSFVFLFSSFDSCLGRDSARHGYPEVFLPILHYALLGYSHTLAAYIASTGHHELYGKSDLRFLEELFQVVVSSSHLTYTLV